MGSPEPTSRPEVRIQITHIGDLEIISREPGMAKHPHPNQNGKLVPFANVEHILLSDSTETNMCTTCGYTNENVQSVVSHGVSHTEKSHRQYDDKTIKAVIQEVLTAKLAGERDSATRAAVVLNKRGIRTVRGALWSSTNVSSVFNTYKNEFPGIRARRSDAALKPKPTDKPQPTLLNDAADDLVAPADAMQEIDNFIEDFWENPVRGEVRTRPDRSITLDLGRPGTDPKIFRHIAPLPNGDILLQDVNKDIWRASRMQ